MPVVLAVLLAGCSDPADDTADPEPAYRVEPFCPRPPANPLRVTVDLVNQVVSSADLPAWQAGDIGASAQLSDDRMVWVFGDTVRTEDFSPRLVANSMLVSSGACVAQLHAPGDGPVIPDVAPDVVRWPMSVVVIQPPGPFADRIVSDVLVVLCARTRRGEGNLDYTFLGTSAAIFTVTPRGAPQLLTILEITPDDDALDQVNWGAAATVSGRWVYVYGTRQTGQDFGRELYVARVPVDDPKDRTLWRFWDGEAWQSHHGRAAAVLPAQGGVSQTLSVHHIDGEWVAVSKRDGDLGDFVYTWAAPTPVGPWTPRRAVAAPAGFETGKLKYAPLAHPEIPLADGNLLVSISRNTTDFEHLLADPEVGRPVFAEVERP